MIRTLFFTALLLFTTPITAQNDLRQEIRNIVKDKKATIGVAVRTSDGRSFAMRNNRCYPLMSVFKFHVAIAALQRMEQEKIAPQNIVTIDSTWLPYGTYSPLRDQNPDRNVRISLAELIHYTISLSDNCTCDWLISFAGGIESVNRSAKNLRIGRFRLTETEATMHEDIQRCYANRSTPRSMVRLLRKVYEKAILNADSFELLEQAMLATSTGSDKLKAGLPEESRIGHKTGHSDRTATGIKIGDNDAGIVYLPDGRWYYIAVFIRDSQESDKTNASAIAEISKAVYHWATSSSIQ